MKSCPKCGARRKSIADDRWCLACRDDMEADEWAKAEIRSLEANVDPPDIPCSAYQRIERERIRRGGRPR